MKHKLREIIDSLETDELLKMRRDIEAGGFHLKRFIDVKIKDQQKKHEKYCTTCSSELDPNNTNNFTLIFGPDDFRKKASFCGLDCLGYFLKELKQIKKVRHV